MGALGVLAGFAAVAIPWKHVPARVPTHFGIGGAPDAWGSRGTLWLLPSLAAGVFVLLTVLARFPHRFNYLWSFGAAAAPVQYRLAVRFLQLLKACVGWLFAVIASQAISVARGEALGIRPVVVYGGVGLMAASLVLYLVLSRRAR